ncbi:MAG: prepilin peptidase [Sphingomonas sp.]|nr:prepilin peptidase [Sphingomonas sp.]
MNFGIAQLLLVILALLLVAAAVIDVRTYTISNRLNVAIALLAPAFWWSVGLELWPGVAVQIALSVGVLAIFSCLFFIGMMGGGDVKLAAALALWLPPEAMLHFVVLMSLAGGVLTLVYVLSHRLASKPGRPKIPYGVAIAIGALAILAQRFLNQFA